MFDKSFSTNVVLPDPEGQQISFREGLFKVKS